MHFSIKSDKKEDVKIWLNNKIDEGHLDSLLFGFCNKALSYSLLPVEIRDSISKSYFYSILHKRQIFMLQDEDNFLDIAAEYYREIEPLLDEPESLQVNITRYCMLNFKEIYKDNNI